MDLKQVRALELEQHGRDESDGPSNEEWLKLLDAIRAGLSGRRFVKQHCADRGTSDVTYQGQSLHHGFFAVGVHCFAEAERREWKNTIAVADCAMLTYDGPQNMKTWQ